MMIAVAGPYSASTAEGRAANLRALNHAAAQVLQRGHVPVVGVTAALPIVGEAAPANVYEAIMTISIALVERCDALWLIAESPGANRERDVMLALGRPVYRTLSEIPLAAG
jgi:hypothetical protein